MKIKKRTIFELFLWAGCIFLLIKYQSVPEYERNRQAARDGMSRFQNIDFPNAASTRRSAGPRYLMKDRDAKKTLHTKIVNGYTFEPVRNATVKVWDVANNMKSQSLRADKKGAIRIKNLSSRGGAIAIAWADGYPKQFVTLPEESELYTQNKNDLITLLPYINDEELSIKGLCMDKNNSPLENIDVFLVHGDHTNQLGVSTDIMENFPRATSDAKGRFSFSVPGLHRLKVRLMCIADGHIVLTRSHEKDARESSLIIHRGQNLSGTLVDENGNPMGKFPMKITSATFQTGISLMTDKDGSFSTKNCGTAPFTIVAPDLSSYLADPFDDRLDYYEEKSTEVALQDDALVKVQLEKKKGLKIKVQDQKGKPVDRIAYGTLLAHMGFVHSMKYAYADDGHYELILSSENQFGSEEKDAEVSKVKIVSYGFKSQEIDVQSLQDEQTITLEPSDTIKGKIIDDTTKEPIKGAVVELINYDHLQHKVSSDKKGYFSFIAEKSEHAHISAMMSSYENGRYFFGQKTEITEGQDEITIALKPAKKMKGIISTTSGDLPKDLYVEMQSKKSPVKEDGSFAIDVDSEAHFDPAILVKDPFGKVYAKINIDDEGTDHAVTISTQPYVLHEGIIQELPDREGAMYREIAFYLQNSTYPINAVNLEHISNRFSMSLPANEELTVQISSVKPEIDETKSVPTMKKERLFSTTFSTSSSHKTGIEIDVSNP